MVVNRTLLSVGIAASKDSNRPALRSVMLRRKGNIVTAAATDSYIFCEVSQVMPNLKEYPKLQSTPTDPSDVMLPASVANKLSTVIRSNRLTNKLLPILNFAVVEENRATTTDLNEETTFGFSPPEGDFPDQKIHESIADYEKKKYVTLHLNSAYIKTVLEVFKGDEAIDVSIPVDDNMAPAFIRSEANGVKKLALIMPMKGDNNAA